MFFIKLRHFAQIVGFAVIGLLIIFGAFSVVRNADRAIGANLLAPSNGPTMQTNVFSGTVPSVIYYQGTLRDAEGNPLSGVHQMAFQVYADVTAPTSEAVWIEQHPEVTVRDGQFSVLLGDLNPIPPRLFQGADRFIGITVDTMDEMVPRQRFAAVPYAMAAAGATYLTAPDATPLKAVAVDNEGQVGIGTESPSAPLHIQAQGQNIHMGPTSINSDSSFQVNDATANNVSLAAGGGLVGMGTTEPTKALHVKNDDPDLALDFNPDGQAVQADISFLENGTQKASLYYSRAKDYIALKTRSTTSMVVAGDKVGIGTSTPASTLDINGGVHVNGPLRVRNKAPILIVRIRDMANDENADSHVSASDYDCVTTSWLGKWNINPNSTGDQGVWTYVNGDSWWVRGEMLSDSDHERLDVDLLCFRRELTELQFPDRRNMNEAR